ncbi:ABC transporter B family member [Trifolium repens]|nr:ABC transporter B family member [Trifolium repens]
MNESPFRFQAAWFTHKDYPQLVKNTWTHDNNNNNIVGCLQNVARESSTFNKEVFGNVFSRKKEVEARLRGIQRALENIDSANLVRLQKELLLTYENILFQEEALWYQKSREQWVKLGSRNTAFFHAQSIIRRKRNKIHGTLKKGNWLRMNWLRGERAPLLEAERGSGKGKKQDDSTADQVTDLELGDAVPAAHVGFFRVFSLVSTK